MEDGNRDGNGERKFKIVRPNEATGADDEVIDAATPMDIEIDEHGMKCTPAELESGSPPDDSHFKQLMVSDLITQCNEAVQRFSSSNPHKILVFNCAMALRQLVDRLEVAESELATLKGKVN